MRVLFDQGTRRRCAMPWLVTPWKPHSSSAGVTLQNGALIAKAESNGFDVLLTTDKNLMYQQNLCGRRIAIVVLSTTSWPRIRVGAAKVVAAVAGAVVGSYVEVAVD